jgi:hypothetical protein
VQEFLPVTWLKTLPNSLPLCYPTCLLIAVFADTAYNYFHLTGLKPRRELEGGSAHLVQTNSIPTFPANEMHMIIVMMPF